MRSCSHFAQGWCSLGVLVLLAPMSRVPDVAKQHEFLDMAKNHDWAGVRRELAAVPQLVNVQPAGRWSALHQAVHADDAEAVRDLLRIGASLHAKTKDGKTPRDVAKRAVVRYLLEMGPTVADDQLQLRTMDKNFVLTVARSPIIGLRDSVELS